MKRFMIFIPLLFIVLGLTSCSTPFNDSQGVEVKDAQLDEEATILLDTLADQSLIYDLKVKDSKVKELEFSVEEYHFGKFKQTLLQGSTPIDKENKKDNIRLLFTRQENDLGPAKWIASFIGKTGTRMAIEKYDNPPKKPIGGFASASSYSELPMTIKVGEKKPIGLRIDSKDDGISIGPSSTEKDGFKRTKKYDRVYLYYLEVK